LWTGCFLLFVAFCVLAQHPALAPSFKYLLNNSWGHDNITRWQFQHVTMISSAIDPVIPIPAAEPSIRGCRVEFSYVLLIYSDSVVPQLGHGTTPAHESFVRFPARPIRPVRSLSREITAGLASLLIPN
jgi:hypothetical protein